MSFFGKNTAQQKIYSSWSKSRLQPALTTKIFLLAQLLTYHYNQIIFQIGKLTQPSVFELEWKFFIILHKGKIGRAFLKTYWIDLFETIC